MQSAYPPPVSQQNLIRIAQWFDGLTYFMSVQALWSDEKLVYVIASHEDHNHSVGFAIYDINASDFIGSNGLSTKKIAAARNFIELSKDDFLEYLRDTINAH